VLSWEPTCTPAADYAAYEGEVDYYDSHIPVGVPGCTTEGATSITLTPGGGNRYYLVVPLDTAEGIEGSYGYESNGTPRVQSFSACEALTVCDCR
jgi:hypothetical protein